MKRFERVLGGRRRPAAVRVPDVVVRRVFGRRRDDIVRASARDARIGGRLANALQAAPQTVAAAVDVGRDVGLVRLGAGERQHAQHGAAKLARPALARARIRRARRRAFPVARAAALFLSVLGIVRH